MFIWRQKTNFILYIFLDILQRYCTCYFEYFGHAWLRKFKVIQSNFRKLYSLSAGKKISFTSQVFLEILQRYANFLLCVPWASVLDKLRAWCTWNHKVYMFPHLIIFCQVRPETHFFSFLSMSSNSRKLHIQILYNNLNIRFFKPTNMFFIVCLCPSSCNLESYCSF